MTESNDYFILAQSSLVYSVEELDKLDVEAFLRLIRAKKNAGWSADMIQTHLTANISARIRNQYPRLRKYQRDVIAEEMIEAMLERIIREGIDVQ